MISKENIKYSLKHLSKSKARSFLTIFSIMVGITTIFIFVSFGYGLYNYTNEFTTQTSADKILVMPKTAGGFGAVDGIVLNSSDLKTIKNTAGVYEATGLYASAVQVKKNTNQKYIFLTAFDPKSNIVLQVANIDIVDGRSLKPGDMAVAILGYNYKIPNKIFSETYELNDNIEIDGMKLKVIGFAGEIGNPADDSQIYISNDQYEKMYPNEKSYAEIIARVNIDDIDEVVSNIEKNLRKHRNVEEGKEDFYVESFNALIESFTGALDIIVGFVILIALMSVIVSTINTANTMITSVLERYKEIGVLKAIGARNSEIFKIFLFESSFLGFIAGTLGCLFGWILSSIGGKILSDLGWSFLQPYFSVYLFVGLILFAVITGAISGAIPAIQASKINTVDALRYE